MTVTALPGNIKLRQFQLGAESTFGTAVAATRCLPWKFAPSVDPHWTSPDIDAGSLDPLVLPYRQAIDVTGQTSGDLAFNDLPYLWTGATKVITPTGAGAAKTWTAVPAYASQDAFQLFTAEWGDETGDQFQYLDGAIDKLSLTWPENMGPVSHSADWRFNTVNYPVARTAALVTDPIPVWMYGADTALYIDDTAGGIGGTQVVNGLHGVAVSISNNLDVKRFMNGSNTRFQASGYGRGARMLETTFTFAKSSTALAEAAKFLAASATERFVSIKTVSPELIPSVATAFSHDLRFSGFWYTRAEGTYANSNTTIQLVCRHRVNGTLAYPFSAVTVCGLASL